MLDKIYDKNIKDITDLGFVNIKFLGYGGTGFRKDDFLIWIDEWGEVTLEKSKQKPIFIGKIMKDYLVDTIEKEIININNF